MTLQDFLLKVRNPKIETELLKRYYREMMYRNLAHDNLDESEKSFILDIILHHRAKLFAGETSSSSDLEKEYYRIWEKRWDLKLEEEDLKNIKEVIYSFKAK